MGNVIVSLGNKVPGPPNIADRPWLTVSDQKNRGYCCQDTNIPSILWVHLTRLDFSEGSGPRRLTMEEDPDLAGDQTANFQPTALFWFLSPDVPH